MMKQSASNADLAAALNITEQDRVSLPDSEPADASDFDFNLSDIEQEGLSATHAVTQKKPKRIRP